MDDNKTPEYQYPGDNITEYTMKWSPANKMAMLGYWVYIDGTPAGAVWTRGEYTVAAREVASALEWTLDELRYDLSEPLGTRKAYTIKNSESVISLRWAVSAAMRDELRAYSPTTIIVPPGGHFFVLEDEPCDS